MKPRKEIISSKGYHLAKIQCELCDILVEYMKEKQLNMVQVESQLRSIGPFDSEGSYKIIKDVFNGDFDYNISTLLNVSILTGKIPVITYVNINEYIEKNK